MRTIPPCYDRETKTDCQKRYVGCKSECEKWHKWLIVHAEEKQRERDRKQADHEVSAVVSTHSQRTRSAKRALYDAKRRA